MTAHDEPSTDGYIWRFEYRPLAYRADASGKLVVPPYVSPTRRQEYLNRALAELRKEAGGDA